MSKLKFGDKVMVTYKNGDQFVGRIKDETEKTWKIEFDDGDVRSIRKTMQIEIVDDPKTEVDETPETPVKKDEKPFEPSHYTPSKKLKMKNTLILVSILVLMGLAGVLIYTSIF